MARAPVKMVVAVGRGGLDLPSAGSVTVNGTDILKLDGDGLVGYRRNTIGFVWQNSARNTRY